MPRWTKRVALLFVVSLMFATCIGTAVAQAGPAVGRVTVTVSNHYPYQYSNITVRSRVYDTAGHVIPGVRVAHKFFYKTTAPVVYKYTNQYGYASFARYTSGAAAGYKVVIRAIASSGGVTKYGTTWFIPKRRTTSTAPTSGTVYITNTGSKYHQGSCGYLSQSKIAISLSNAKAQGYTACSVCF